MDMAVAWWLRAGTGQMATGCGGRKNARGDAALACGRVVGGYCGRASGSSCYARGSASAAGWGEMTASGVGVVSVRTDGASVWGLSLDLARPREEWLRAARGQGVCFGGCAAGGWLKLAEAAAGGGWTEGGAGGARRHRGSAAVAGCPRRQRWHWALCQSAAAQKGNARW